MMEPWMWHFFPVEPSLAWCFGRSAVGCGPIISAGRSSVLGVAASFWSWNGLAFFRSMGIPVVFPSLDLGMKSESSPQRSHCSFHRPRTGAVEKKIRPHCGKTQ